MGSRELTRILTRKYIYELLEYNRSFKQNYSEGLNLKQKILQVLKKKWPLSKTTLTTKHILTDQPFNGFVNASENIFHGFSRLENFVKFRLII